MVKHRGALRRVVGVGFIRGTSLRSFMFRLKTAPSSFDPEPTTTRVLSVLVRSRHLENCLSLERAPSNRRVDQASGSVSIVAVGILTSVAGRFSPVASPSTLVAVFSAQSESSASFALCNET